MKNIVFISLFLFSCTKQENSVNTMKLACGAETETGRHYVEVLPKIKIQSALLVDQGESSRALNITSGGCIESKKPIEGTLHIRATDGSLNYYKSYTVSPELRRIRLPKTSSQLTPAKVFCRKSAAPAKFNIESSSVDPLLFTVRATVLDEEKKVVLDQIASGKDKLLDVSEIDDGVYTLSLEVADKLFSTKEKTECKLTIDKKRPKVLFSSKLVDVSEFVTVPANQPLSFSFEDESSISSVEYCVLSEDADVDTENLTKLAFRKLKESSCIESSYLVDGLKLESGDQDVIVFVEDEAGNYRYHIFNFTVIDYEKVSLLNSLIIESTKNTRIDDLNRYLDAYERLKSLTPEEKALLSFSSYSTFGYELKSFALDGRSLGIHEGILIAGLKRGVSFIEIETGKTLRTFATDAEISRMSTFGQLVAVGTGDGHIQIYDASKQKRLVNKKISEYGITDIEFSPDGANLVALYNGGFGAGVLDLQGQSIKTFSSMFYPLTAGALSKSGETLFLADGGGSLRVIDLKSNKEQEIAIHEDWVHDLVYDSSRDALISASEDFTVKIFDLATNRVVKGLYGHQSPVLDLALGQGGIIFSSSDAGKIFAWNSDNKLERKIDAHTSRIYQAVYSNDRLYSVGDDSAARVWELKHPSAKILEYPGIIRFKKIESDIFFLKNDGSLLRFKSGPESKSSDIRSPNYQITDITRASNKFYTTDNFGKLLEWSEDFATSKMIVDLEAFVYGIEGDGSSILIASSDGLTRVALADPSTPQSLLNDDQPTYIVKADKELIIGYLDGTIKNLNGDVLYKVDSLRTLSEGLDGSFYVAGKDNEIWNVNGKQSYSLSGHNSDIADVIRLTDNIEVSIAKDRTLKFWDKQKEVLSLNYFGDFKDLLRLDDSRFLLSDSKSVVLFDISSERLRQIACEVVSKHEVCNEK